MLGRSAMVVDYHGPRYQAKSFLLQFYIPIIVFSIKRFVASLNSLHYLELSTTIFCPIIDVHLLKITYLLLTKQDISQYKIVTKSDYSLNNTNIYHIYITKNNPCHYIYNVISWWSKFGLTQEFHLKINLT